MVDLAAGASSRIPLGQLAGLVESLLFVAPDPVQLTALADALGRTPAQVILRWHIEIGSLPIPKSATPSRQAENLDIFGFELTDDEVAAISGLAEDGGRLFGGDPRTHEEM